MNGIACWQRIEGGPAGSGHREGPGPSPLPSIMPSRERQCMASPQLEDGYTRIANEILLALCFMNLSPYESRLLNCVIRQTYGWRKKTDWIALSQFSKKTGLDRRLAHRALNGLMEKGMVVICRDDKKHPRYGFQKDYDKWRLSPLQRNGLREEVEKERERRKKKSISTDDRVSSPEIPTKETLTEYTVKKKEERELEEREPSPSLVLPSPLTHESPETPSSKDKRETPFSGLRCLISNTDAFREELRNRGYRLSGSNFTMLCERLAKLADEKGNISDADIERVVVKEIIRMPYKAGRPLRT